MTHVTTRQKWRTAKAEVDRIETMRAQLVAHTDNELDMALAKLHEIEDAEGGVISRCEGCMDPIFEGDPYFPYPEECLYFCKKCAPTYKDVLDEPEGYLDHKGNPMTADTAKAFVDKHVNAGGAITDSLAS